MSYEHVSWKTATILKRPQTGVTGNFCSRDGRWHVWKSLANHTPWSLIMNVNHLVIPLHTSWWRHQMETFFALLAFCVGNSPLTSEFPTQRPVTRSFDVFFGLRLNKRFSKQSSGWWFETPSRPLWRLCNDGGSLGGLSCSIFRPCYWETKIGVYRRIQ